MKKTLLLILRIALIALVFGTLLFTFYQSSLPKAESSEVSDGASEKLEPIIPSTTPTGEFVHTNIRKIAHFVEFAILGYAVALYVVTFMRRKFIGISYLAAPIVALIDETIQVFSERGPSVTDIWLDISGFVFSASIVYITLLAVVLIPRLFHRKK
ncbi:MAG: VanZ family protein [Clostridia bacterium]|nr:VanZ family protein [Clostridia bacterium]